jgi:hypothetical protein
MNTPNFLCPQMITTELAAHSALLGPLFGFVCDELGEIGWRAGQHCTAKVGKTRLKPWFGEDRIDFLVELVHDFSRRVPGRDKATKAMTACRSTGA